MLLPNLNKPFFELNPDKKALVKDGKCPECKACINESEFSAKEKREFMISGMCHTCQRALWGK